LIVNELPVSLAIGKLFTSSWSPEKLHSSTPILLLHDSLGSVELWRNFPEQLAGATQRRVIAYDRLGYGKSDANPELPDDNVVESESRTVAELLDALVIQECAVFGHSIGGEMAVACAARLPDRISAVIAESAQCWLEEETLAAIRAGRAQFDHPEQMERLRKYHGDKAQWVLNAWAATWLRPSMRGWSILPEAAKVHCPLLAIHGDNDGFTSVEQPRRLAETVAGPAHVEIIENCGHIPHREQAERVLSVVADFLRHVD
jgi:pimeloyl-ACP methyl ester carboxylesterase